MGDLLLWFVLGGTILNAVLIAVILFRFSRTTVKGAVEGADETVRNELRLGREEANKSARELRQEVTEGLKSTNQNVVTTLGQIGQLQQTELHGMTRQLKGLAESSQSALEQVRTALDSRLKELQEGNEKKLEEMRKTVDEKLQDTLQKRLGESFELVSGQLERVQKGLGEMQNLATGVGDLRRVLTNVKARGTWAEVQLGALLEQILAPGQYEKNVRVKADTNERVEYAIRLPGPKDEPDTCVWLPIDSKFPQEDYLRIQDAADQGDPDAVQKAVDALSRSIKSFAQDIHAKYHNPPETTDFAIMFLATEGLYAEVLRQPTVVERLQVQYRIVIAGPTTLAAILSSLRLGFQTLAIEKRASEVWKILSAVKTEFAKFGKTLDTVKRQLNAATNTIVETGTRTRAMERKLRSVEQLPELEASEVLQLDAPNSKSEVDAEEVEGSTDANQDLETQS
ncbi:MAG: DNA recombination protein RmuC [candidate division Zixibacteria bacterium]|nr:DNA recombination protein RmuC [candidate division Zixibacteria bacterium]